MAELDVEALERWAEDGFASGEDFQHLSEMLPTIIVALKDRDRLQAAARKVCAAMDLPALPGDTSAWFRVPTADLLALEAALEDRDG